MKLVVTKRDIIIVGIVGLLATADLLGFFQGSVVEVDGIKLQKPFLSKYSATYVPNSVEEDGQSYKVKDGMLLFEFEYSYTFTKLFGKCEEYSISMDDDDRYTTSVYHHKTHLLVAIISKTKEDVHSFAEQICKSQ